MCRHPGRLTLLTLVAATTVLPWAAAAEEAKPSAPPDGSVLLLEHLSGIDRSLQEISILLASLLDHQQVSVLLNRMQLKERSLAPLRASLENARAERDGISEERKRMRMFREEWEQERAAAAPGSQTDEAQEREMRRLLAEVERLEDREAVLAQRIIELEDDLAQRRDDIRALEEMVDTRLGLR